MDQEYTKKIERQIQNNRALIEEARQTIEKMRALFKSVGADIDANDNIFLKSSHLSAEGRHQAEEIIRNLETEMADREKDYHNAVKNSPVDKIIQRHHQNAVNLSKESVSRGKNSAATAINPVEDRNSYGAKRSRIKKVRL